MPELPEVETIRRDLALVLPGRKLIRVSVRLKKMAHPIGPRNPRWPIGDWVLAVHRRAKVLLIHFKGGRTLAIHLRMSGQLIWLPTHGRIRVGGHPIPGGVLALPNKYSHIILKFSGGQLFFNDQRQFGFVRVDSTVGIQRWLVEKGYGPEPLDDHFTPEVFDLALRRAPRRRLKSWLLDQRSIAGIGNIYADESCFRAYVRPMRRINTLSPRERRNLYRGIRRVLLLAVRNRGTTANSYRDASGRRGRMWRQLHVYGREGQSCHRCGGVIRRVVFQQRGTRFCPECQR